MKHMAVILLCAAAFAAQATTVDYTVALDPNGFNVYEVTKDTQKKVVGSPFGSNYVQYVGTDGTYIYALTSVPPPMPGPYPTSEMVTYAVNDGKPKQVAVLKDSAYQMGCGHCIPIIRDMVTTPQHIFVKVRSIGQGI